jgi:hypothetical protein
MKRKIKFKEVLGRCINGWWDEKELELFQWILNSSQEFQNYTDGMHKVLFNYSAYNHNHFTGFITANKYHDQPMTIGNRLLIAFTNAFVFEGSQNSILGKWQAKERISLNGSRMLNFADDCPANRSVGSEFDMRRTFDMRWELYRLASFQGKALKKEHFHPDYPERIKPFIKFIDFSIVGSRDCAYPFFWTVKLDFTFDIPGYESNCWDYNFSQRKDESVARFFWRVNRKIENELLDKSDDQKSQIVSEVALEGIEAPK